MSARDFVNQLVQRLAAGVRGDCKVCGQLPGFIGCMVDTDGSKHYYPGDSAEIAVRAWESLGNRRPKCDREVAIIARRVVAEPEGLVRA